MGLDEFMPRCEPTTEFFRSVSRLLNTCIPTPSAFISSLLGTLSICSWLFAQAPQVIKNYRYASTSGLSIYFLIEWCMGDLCNFLGSIFTNQASWQIIIGAYYCTIDCCLIAQWIWYEKLNHGKKLRRMMRNKFKRDPDAASLISFDFGQARNPMKLKYNKEARPLLRSQTAPQDPFVEHKQEQPGYGSSLTSYTTKASPSKRKMYSQSTRTNLYLMPPSKTFLLISMLIALATTSPIFPPDEPASPSASNTAKDIFGTIMSWASAILYLASRFPQILTNWRRRSTAGLSPLLFGAAFCGNLFYASSMLANPSLWHSYRPYGAHGWIRDSPSDREEWFLAALPFFIGAAGVLMMDATVGIQFWYFAKEESKEETGEVYAVEGVEKKWKEVTGWMRGWKPCVSERI